MSEKSTDIKGHFITPPPPKRSHSQQINQTIRSMNVCEMSANHLPLRHIAASYFARYVSCSGCCNLIHPQCVPSPPTPADDLSTIPSYEPTLCSACRRVNVAPSPRPAISQANCWGDLNAEEIFDTLNSIAPAISTWRPNLFQVPFGTVGRSFIDELTRLTNLFATSTTAERLSSS